MPGGAAANPPQARIRPPSRSRPSPPHPTRCAVVSLLVFVVVITLTAGPVARVRAGIPPTDWTAVISPALLPLFMDGLPTPPPAENALPTPASWSSDPDGPPKFVYEPLSGTSVPDVDALRADECRNDTASPVVLGSRETLPDGRSGCRVWLDDQGSLRLLNKPVLGSIWDHPTARPSWVMMRYPVPPGSVASELRITLDNRYGTNLHGGLGGCPAGSNHSVCPLCVDVPDQWDRDAPPGFHLLWTRPGQAGFVVDARGPFNNDTLEYTVPVPPAALDGVDPSQPYELDVVLLTYSQYPTTDPTEFDDYGRCRTSVQWSMLLNRMVLFSVDDSYTGFAPDPGQPRLFGNDVAWLDWMQPLDDLGPTGSSTGEDGWGAVVDVASVWQRATRGDSSTPPPSVADHPELSKYLDTSSAFASRPSAREHFRAIHLLRRERACWGMSAAAAASGNAGSGVVNFGLPTSGPGPYDTSLCQFPLDQVENVSLAVVQVEIHHLDSTVWTTQGLEFDLGTHPPGVRWALTLDTLRPVFSPADLVSVQDAMAYRLGAFVDHWTNAHWALFNGNNWTPFLATPALYMAIALWDDRPSLAREVLRVATNTLWLHRDMYTDYGAYVEGVREYSFMSADNLAQVEAVLHASQSPRNATATASLLAFIPWHRLGLAARWQVDLMLPDGVLPGFGDSHAGRGWGSHTPLRSALLSSLYTTGTPTVPPCLTRRFWLNKWFSGDFGDNPWAVHPVMALDWSAIASSCDPVANASSIVGGMSFYPTSGDVVIRQPVTGAAALAAARHEEVLADLNEAASTGRTRRAEQLLQTAVALHGLPNAYPHSELDYGTVVWTAYGARLLRDAEYGTIANEYTGRWRQFDNNPAGHNTLVVREATSPTADPYANFTASSSGGDGPAAADGSADPENASQFDYEAGPVSIMHGEVQGVLANGSAVYGATRPPGNGWLAAFHRYLMPLEEPAGEGHFLLLDTFTVADGRPPLTVDSFFHAHPPPSVDASACNYAVGASTVLVNPRGVHNSSANVPMGTAVDVLPLCDSLYRNSAARGAGRMVTVHPLHRMDACVQPPPSSELPGAGWVVDGLLSFPLQWSGMSTRTKFRLTAGRRQDVDVRPVVMLAGNTAGDLPVASVVEVECPSYRCFIIRISSARGSKVTATYTVTTDVLFWTADGRPVVELKEVRLDDVANATGIPVCPSVSPSVTPTRSATATVTNTPSATVTTSATHSHSTSPSFSSSVSPRPSPSPSPSPSATSSSSASSSSAPSSTASTTSTPTHTLSTSLSGSPSRTSSSSSTQSPSSSRSQAPTLSQTPLSPSSSSSSLSPSPSLLVSSSSSPSQSQSHSHSHTATVSTRPVSTVASLLVRNIQFSALSLDPMLAQAFEAAIAEDIASALDSPSVPVTPAHIVITAFREADGGVLVEFGFAPSAASPPAPPSMTMVITVEQVAAAMPMSALVDPSEPVSSAMVTTTHADSGGSAEFPAMAVALAVAGAGIVILAVAAFTAYRSGRSKKRRRVIVGGAPPAGKPKVAFQGPGHNRVKGVHNPLERHRSPQRGQNGPYSPTCLQE